MKHLDENLLGQCADAIGEMTAGFTYPRAVDPLIDAGIARIDAVRAKHDARVVGEQTRQYLNDRRRVANL